MPMIGHKSEIKPRRLPAITVRSGVGLDGLRVAFALESGVPLPLEGMRVRHLLGKVKERPRAARQWGTELRIRVQR